MNFFEHVTQVRNRIWLYEVAEVWGLIYYLPVLAVQRGNHAVLWGMRTVVGGEGDQERRLLNGRGKLSPVRDDQVTRGRRAFQVEGTASSNAEKRTLEMSKKYMQKGPA